jgi:hypothetical protein
MKPTNLIITLLFLSCNNPSPTQKTQETTPKTVVSEPEFAKSERFKIIHVFVALCDNTHQGIVKVPPKIGNGQDPENNLYWGCDLGTKTFIKKHKDWSLVQTVPNPRDKVLERCIFKHKTKDVLMVADAYDGEFIKLCTIDFFKSCSGNFNNVFTFENDTLACGGQSDLLGYIGHNGLMEFEIEEKFPPKKPHKRDAIILGCFSKFDFSPHLKQTGAEPLVWTTGLMAPEAYTLVAAIEGWILGKNKEETSEMAAQAYQQYQKCSIIGARKLLVTGW